MNNIILKVDWSVSPKLKPYLIILTSEPIKEELIKLFCKATELIAPLVRPGKIKVIFTRKCFTITIDDNIIGCRFRELLIFDLSKIEKISDERYVIAAFVEEFVHSYLDSDDEELTARKVVELYPALVFDQKTGEYLPRL